MSRTGFLLSVLFLLASLAFAQDPAVVDSKHYSVVLENARVRILRFTLGPGEKTATHRHPDAVFVLLPDGASREVGQAAWLPELTHEQENANARPAHAIIVELKGEPGAAGPSAEKALPAPPAAGAQPGESPFTGVSFDKIFENDRVTVSRARMDVNAREGWHTHGADIVVVHLSGGEIEDAAGGETKVNKWKRGDVEFEAKGSSHSARNLGGAIEVILVALK